MDGADENLSNVSREPGAIIANGHGRFDVPVFRGTRIDSSSDTNAPINGVLITQGSNAALQEERNIQLGVASKPRRYQPYRKARAGVKYRL